jgi:protein O-GlcNAc transferase
MTSFRRSRTRCPILVIAAWLFAAVSITAAGDDQGHREALMHYRAGKQSMSSERWAEAVLELREAVKLDPLLAVAHYDLGQVFMAAKRYPDAIRAYLGAKQAFADLAALEQTDRFKAEESRDDQIRELRNFLVRARQTNNAAYDHLQIQIEDQIHSLEAMKNKGLARQSETPAELSMALGSAYYRTGALEDAAREYVAAIKVRPGFGEAHNNLAAVLMLDGRFDEAEKEIGLAEKAGFKVSPKFKEDLERRMRAR